MELQHLMTAFFWEKAFFNSYEKTDRAYKLLEAISICETNGELEFKEKLMFFLELGRSASCSEFSNKCIGIAISLLDGSTKTTSFDGLVSFDPLPNLSMLEMGIPEPVILSPELCGKVASSLNRCSIISSDFKYVHTSVGNAKFYDRPRSDIQDKSIEQIIGNQRFNERAKQYFESCFSGENQEYMHGYDLGKRKGMLKVEMKPIYEPDGSHAGALVLLEDVTRILGVFSSNNEELPKIH